MVAGPVSPVLDPRRCVHDEHTLVCSCGHRLERVTRPAAESDGGEWQYRSLKTGRAVESRLPAPLDRLTWAELAARDIAAYSVLSARESLGMLAAVHRHQPVDCGGHPDPLVVLEHCGAPMRLSPGGWRCRAHCDP